MSERAKSAEWMAFNDAFRKESNAAMESTSIGLGQIMGFHYKRLGFDSVGDMWDDAKKGIENQLHQILQFIKTDIGLYYAIEHKDWDTVAKLYNGSGYKKLAKSLDVGSPTMQAWQKHITNTNHYSHKNKNYHETKKIPCPDLGVCRNALEAG